MSAIREQPTLQASASAPEQAPAGAGVSLAELLKQGRRRGLVTLPPYLTVSLVQQLCRALQLAHEQGAVAMGELTLDTVVLGFEGRVRPTAFGEAPRDVAAAALVLDHLLGDTLDPELIRIIGDARLKDPAITTALGLEQRLAHWQVKQRQLFPGQDLTAALAAWLFPDHARAVPSEEVAEWLQAQCTGPIVEEPAPERAVEPSRLVNWRWIGAVATVLFGLALGLLFQALTLKRHDVVAPPLPIAVAPPVMMPAVTEVRLAPPAEPEPTLPRTATGAPAKLQLSSWVHGVRLETSGFPVTAPAKRWAVKVLPARGQKKAPKYASLFVAELGTRHVARLARVGAEGWLPLTAPQARVFLMQTDQRADEGTFNIAVGVRGLEDVKQTELREDVLTDAMTQIEYSRFVLDGLELDQVYEVTQRPSPKGPTPPVIATVTIPNVHTRSLRGAGFKQAGAPLDQVLLQPGAPVKVSGVSRLSFVVLTTADAPEMLSSIDVAPRGAAPPPKRGSPPVPGESCRDFAPPGVDCAALEQVGAGKR